MPADPHGVMETEASQETDSAGLTHLSRCLNRTVFLNVRWLHGSRSCMVLFRSAFTGSHKGEVAACFLEMSGSVIPKT